MAEFEELNVRQANGWLLGILSSVIIYAMMLFVFCGQLFAAIA